MKFTIKLIPLFLLLLVFQGCSWVNTFYIINSTSSKIKLEFYLSETESSFPIFYDVNSCKFAYELTKNGNIDKEKPVTVVPIKIDSKTHFSIIIPANTALQIGALHNDNYTSHNQTFINGREFNLISITHLRGNMVVVIDPDEFDKRLIRESGELIYKITN